MFFRRDNVFLHLMNCHKFIIMNCCQYENNCSISTNIYITVVCKTLFNVIKTLFNVYLINFKKNQIYVLKNDLIFPPLNFIEHLFKLDQLV